MRTNLTKKQIVNSIYMQIGFSKKISENLLEDVFQIIFKKIDSGHAAEVCMWSTECIISGYLDELWDKCLEYYTK